jgi:hypothetical protein
MFKEHFASSALPTSNNATRNTKPLTHLEFCVNKLKLKREDEKFLSKISFSHDYFVFVGKLTGIIFLYLELHILTPV